MTATAEEAIRIGRADAQAIGYGALGERPLGNANAKLDFLNRVKPKKVFQLARGGRHTQSSELEPGTGDAQLVKKPR